MQYDWVKKNHSIECHQFQVGVLELDQCGDRVIEKLTHHRIAVVVSISAHQVTRIGDELALTQQFIKV